MLWLLALLVGCAPTEDPSLLDDLRVGGCALWAGDTCRLSGNEGIAWWSGDGVTVNGAPTADDHVVLPAGPVVVRREVDGRFAERRLTLVVADETPCRTAAMAAEGCDGRAAARAVCREGGPSDASLGARLGSGCVPLDDTVADLAAAADAHLAAGTPTGALRDQVMAIYLELSRGRIEVARQQLAALAETPPIAADSAQLATWIRGEVAKTLGDHRTALDAYTRQADLEAHMGRFGRTGGGASERAESLQRIGRHPEALAVLEAQVAGTDPCDPARNNHAWGLLLAREAGVDTAADPLDVLGPTVDALAAGTCTGPLVAELRVHVAQNLALAHIQRGDAEAAAAAVAVEPVTDEQRTWRTVLDARIAEARGDAASAVDAWRAVVDSAGPRLDLVWRARAGVADALADLGDRNAALAAFAESAAAVDAQAVLVPVHGGRDAFLSQRQPAVARHVALLLDADRPADALRVVRRHRGQYLATLRQLAALSTLDDGEAALWASTVEAGLSADRLDAAAALFVPAPAEPRPPAPGEVLVTWMPLREGWVAFAADATGVVAARIPEVDASADDLGSTLFGPIRESLARAEVVTVLPTPELEAVDLHLLPLDGAPLLAGRTVRSGLDLAATAPREPDAPTSGLLVYNPDDRLVGALREGRAVGEVLGDRVRPLTYPDADRARVLAELGGVDLLHYAGHAVSGSASFGGALHLADGELSGADVLASRAPAVAVLSACDTGRGSEATVASLGLAQSFAAAGASMVIATARPLDDDVGAAFARALYTALPEVGWSEAYRRAVLASGPEAAAFRLYVP